MELLQRAGCSSLFPKAVDPVPTPCNVVFCNRGCSRFAQMQFSPRSSKLCSGMTLVCCALGHFYMYHQVDHTSYQDSVSKDALCLFPPALLLTFWNGFILQCSLSLPAPRDRGFGCQRLLQLCTSGYSSPCEPVSSKRGENSIHLNQAKQFQAAASVPKDGIGGSPENPDFVPGQCVISKLWPGSSLTRIKAEFPMGSSHCGLKGSKSILMVVGKSGVGAEDSVESFSSTKAEIQPNATELSGRQEKGARPGNELGKKAFLSCRMHSTQRACVLVINLFYFEAPDTRSQHLQPWRCLCVPGTSFSLLFIARRAAATMWLQRAQGDPRV